MEINALKAQIKSGEFDKYYIFHGEEHQVMKIYIQKMAEKTKADIQYIDSIFDLMAQTKSKSLIKQTHVYIIMDDKEFLSNEKAWTAFQGVKDSIVIFYYTKADKRLKFWKHFKDRAVEFQKLEERILVKYIQKEIDLSEENCKKLIEICESDYSRILLEIDKIKQYSEGNPTLIRNVENNAFEMLIKDGTVYVPAKDAIFDFVAAVLDRNVILAYELLEQSYGVGEANLTLLSVLYNSAKTLLQVQSSKNYKELGLNGFSVKNVLPYKNRYTNGELVKMMKLIRTSEKGIKTGEIPDDISVEKILVEVM